MKNLYAIWEEDGAFGVVDGLAAAIGPISWAALLLAVFLPVLLIYCRNEIRTRRLRLIADFILSYPATRNKKSVSADATEAEATSNPSLELVTSKYLSDLGDPDYKLSKPNSVELVQEIERRIRSSRLFGNLGDYRLLIASIGFMILCYFGFLNLFAVVTRGFEVLTASGGRACDIAAVAGATCCAAGSVHSQLQIVGSLAFAGAFIAATRQFVRSLAVFDLSAYTFVWQAVEIFASVIIVIFLYEAFEDPSKAVEGLMTGNAIARQCADVPWIWMALAPLLGLLPQSSTKFLLLKLQSLVAWVKMDDDRFNTVTRLTPLDVIDGIDYSIRFRLEECGIYDVQNLATYNPIMLHIESPYGIYQTVDWVGQAQLCSIIGLDKFLLLRQMNIRTVFDLERALDYRAFDDRRSVMTDGPDEFDKIYAGILFAATGTMRKIGETSGLQPIVIRQAQPNDAPVVEAVSIEAYCAWACQTITASPERTKLCMEHLMGWIADDLHVRRLRRIWQEMSDDLGDRSKRMDSTYPARPPAPVPPVPAPQPPAPDPAP